MVSTEKITDKFEQLDEFLSLLERIKRTAPASFLKDKLLRAPKDYADAFKVLEENDVLDEDLGVKLRQMAKFRNRLVHLYGEIDDAYVHAFIKNDLQDILDFKKAVAERFFR